MTIFSPSGVLAAILTFRVPCLPMSEISTLPTVQDFPANLILSPAFISFAFFFIVLIKGGDL